MKRSSRSFTVEVRRARGRTGETQTLGQAIAREFASPSSLSWDELLKRLPDNRVKSALQETLSQKRSEALAEKRSAAKAVQQAAGESEHLKRRVLPSLIPQETALGARRPALHAPSASAPVRAAQTAEPAAAPVVEITLADISPALQRKSARVKRQDFWKHRLRPYADRSSG